MNTRTIVGIAWAAISFTLHAQTDSALIHVEDFEGPVGSEWSSRAITLYSHGAFLGQMGGNDAVTFTLRDLPPHTNLFIAFDLLILKAWHGNNAADGLATWELAVAGQHTPLIRTTFSTNPDYNQSFPHNYKSTNPARSGSVTNNNLGFLREGAEVIRDSIYKLQFNVAHSNETIQLTFRGTGLASVADQSWGLDNVVVATSEPPDAPAPASNNIVLAESTFDGGSEAWSDWDANGRSAPITYHPTGGLHGGYVSLDEVGNGDGATTFWIAPGKFLGDRREAFGGSIEFSAKQSSRNEQYGNFNKKCVVLLGGGLTLNYASPYRPSDVWTHFAVPLLPAHWQVDDGSGRAPTMEEMLHVLGNLTGIQIRAEYRSGNDVNSLDRVRLVAGRPDALSPFFIRAEASGTVALHWPSSRTALKLQSSASIDGVYSDVTGASRSVTNGLQTLRIDAMDAMGFFRLVKMP